MQHLGRRTQSSDDSVNETAWRTGWDYDTNDHSDVDESEGTVKQA
jgi:hypothetical protein